MRICLKFPNSCPSIVTIKSIDNNSHRKQYNAFLVSCMTYIRYMSCHRNVAKLLISALQFVIALFGRIMKSASHFISFIVNCIGYINIYVFILFPLHFLSIILFWPFDWFSVGSGDMLLHSTDIDIEPITWKRSYTYHLHICIF